MCSHQTSQQPAQKGASTLQPMAQMSCEPGAPFVGILPQNPARCNASLLIPKQPALPSAWYLPALRQGRNIKDGFLKKCIMFSLFPVTKGKSYGWQKKGVSIPQEVQPSKIYICVYLLGKREGGKQIAEGFMEQEALKSLVGTKC